MTNRIPTSFNPASFGNNEHSANNSRQSVAGSNGLRAPETPLSSAELARLVPNNLFSNDFITDITALNQRGMLNRSDILASVVRLRNIDVDANTSIDFQSLTENNFYLSRSVAGTERINVLGVHTSTTDTRTNSPYHRYLDDDWVVTRTFDLNGNTHSDTLSEEDLYDENGNYRDGSSGLKTYYQVNNVIGVYVNQQGVRISEGEVADVEYREAISQIERSMQPSAQPVRRDMSNDLVALNPPLLQPRSLNLVNVDLSAMQPPPFVDGGSRVSQLTRLLNSGQNSQHTRQTVTLSDADIDGLSIPGLQSSLRQEGARSPTRLNIRTNNSDTVQNFIRALSSQSPNPFCAYESLPAFDVEQEEIRWVFLAHELDISLGEFVNILAQSENSDEYNKLVVFEKTLFLFDELTELGEAESGRLFNPTPGVVSSPLTRSKINLSNNEMEGFAVRPKRISKQQVQEALINTD